MVTRQDQLHSYQFGVQRVVSALVMRETDPARPAFRRVTAAALAGMLVAALGLAGVAVYAVLHPSVAADWRATGAVIVERETGARYVYLDGTLHPVAGYASALLILASAETRTVTVPRGALAGAPRGRPLGIPGAPDSIPEAGRLLAGAWTLCSVGEPPSSVLYVGGRYVADGRPGADGRYVGDGPSAGGGHHEDGSPGAGQALEPDSGLLAATPDGETFLVWHGHRFGLPPLALGALAWRGEPVARVSPALANGLPAGPDLRPPPVSGRGRPSAATGARVGQVFVVATQGGGRQYALAVPEGLAPISQVQADLLLGDPGTEAVQGRSGAIEMSAGGYNSAPLVAPLVPAPGELAPPLTTPRLTRPDAERRAICLAASGTGAVAVTVDVPLDGGTPGQPGTGTAARGQPAADPVPGGGRLLADRIVVPPGRGALVAVDSSPDAPSGTVCLVTDQATRYPVPAPEVLPYLGYGKAVPVRVPASLVSLVPAGPALDPVAARA